MAPVIDQSQDVSFLDFGDSILAGFEYVGQTFTAAGSRLDSIDFFIDPIQGVGGGALGYRVLVTTVNINDNGFHPGAILFESGKLTEPVGDGFQQVSVDTGHLTLTPGVTYAFILEAFTDRDGLNSFSFVQVSHSDTLGSNYPDGYAVNLQNADLSQTRAQHFAADWTDHNFGSESVSEDLAFRLFFSEPPPPPPPPVTITGTKGKDLIDATHAPTGQAFPSASDDLIFGLGKSDTLFGLGGNDSLDGGKDEDKLFGGDGNDTLIGGKDKDQLSGEGGADAFLFNAKLKGPPDKIMDFVAADDTILLGHNIFKAFTEGPLLPTAFSTSGPTVKDEAVILYKANGKLLYDKDGKGGHDAIAFAKVIDAPVLTDADFIVVA